MNLREVDFGTPSCELGMLLVAVTCRVTQRTRESQRWRPHHDLLVGLRRQSTWRTPGPTVMSTEVSSLITGAMWVISDAYAHHPESRQRRHLALCRYLRVDDMNTSSGTKAAFDRVSSKD